MLAESGVATIDADEVGHEVLERSGPAYEEVATRWPEVIADGSISRPALAKIVFSDHVELKALESITHPHIFGTVRARVEDYDPPIVVEIPLLEHGLGSYWARMVVDSRDDAKLMRALERGMTETDARARLDAQPTREEWLAAADIVIPNHGSIDELRAVVAQVVPHL